MAKNQSVKVMTREEWLAEGERRFGKDMALWRFKCPVCGNVQSIKDFQTLIKNPQNYVYFSCIGRFLPDCPGNFTNKKSPCDYTLGGLFTLHKVAVIMDGKKNPVFEFAD